MKITTAIINKLLNRLLKPIILKTTTANLSKYIFRDCTCKHIYSHRWFVFMIYKNEMIPQFGNKLQIFNHFLPIKIIVYSSIYTYFSSLCLVFLSIQIMNIFLNYYNYFIIFHFVAVWKLISQSPFTDHVDFHFFLLLIVFL